ncbi:MAG: hypothetical protein WEB00_12275 [Dehalococcoidia bacterium]
MGEALDGAKGFVDKINRHDEMAIELAMSFDHAFIDAAGTRAEGREKADWPGYFKWVPDYRIDVDQWLEDGETVAAFGKASGTFVQGAQRLDENRWEVPAAWRGLVRYGKVKEWQVYCDTHPMKEILTRLR